MRTLEKKAEPDHVRQGNHLRYFNLKLSGVSLKVVKQKSEMEYVHMMIFAF